MRTPEQEKQRAIQERRIRRIRRLRDTIANDKAKHQRTQDRLAAELLEVIHGPGCSHTDLNGAFVMGAGGCPYCCRD